MAGGRFDLAAYRASQSELNDETFDVFLGETKDGESGEVTEDIIHIPNLKHWTLDSQTKFGQNDIEGGMAAILGEENAHRLLAAPPEGAGLTVGEFQELFEQVAKWSGFPTGQPSVPPPPPGLTQKSNSRS